jgi:syntaxin 5
MVAEQRDTVQRIDADTHDIAANVEGGQRELLKVLARVSNSRWLMLKIFGVLIVFVSLCLIKLSFSIYNHICSKFLVFILVS